jgi:hypothetical protein
MYKSKIRYKNHHLGQGKEIRVFIKQRLKLTTFAGRCFVNLVQDSLENAPSTPSEYLLSQYYDHLKGREWIVWEKRGMLRQ